MSPVARAHKVQPRRRGTAPQAERARLEYDWVRDYERHTVARVRVMLGNEKIYGRNVKVDEPKDCAAFEDEVKAKCNGNAPPNVADRLMKLEPTAEAPEPTGGATQDDHPFNGKPRPWWNCSHGDMGVLTRDCVAALRALNDPPSLFVFQKMVAVVGWDPEDEVTVVEPLDMVGLTDGIGERTRPYSESKSEGRRIKTPSERLVKGVLHHLRKRNLLPILRGVTNVPQFTAQGTLLDKPGYDREAKLYYSPIPGLIIPTVPERPPLEDVAEAVRLIMVELTGDFPFINRADKANAIALPVEQLARELIDGQLPMHCMESNEAGTGKDLLAGVLLRIIAGPHVVRCPFSTSEEERRRTSQP
jgi:hypothetical protein